MPLLKTVFLDPFPNTKTMKQCCRAMLYNVRTAIKTVYVYDINPKFSEDIITLTFLLIS